MKACLSFLATLLFCFSAHTQGFSLVRTNGELYYSNQYSIQPASSVPNSHNFDHSIRIDSQYVNGNETHYFNHPGLKVVMNGSCDWKPFGNSWLGPEVIDYGNGVWQLFNGDLDTLVFHTNGSGTSTWKFYTWPNGNYLEATRGSAFTQSTLGITDSVFEVDLQGKDSLGNNISSLFNGYKFKISKEFGLVETLDFSQFPQRLIEMTLEGSTNPKIGRNNPTFLDLYEQEVGDEIHVRYYGNYGLPGGSETTTQTRIIILSKYLSPAKDTLVLKSERLWHNKVYDYDSNTTTITTGLDTTIQIWHAGQHFWKKMSVLPEDTKDPENALLGIFDHAPMFYETRFNGRMLKSDGEMYWYDSDSMCYNELIVGPTQTWAYSIEGLGGLYWYATDGVFINTERWPVYYRLGNKTWGTPIKFSSLISTEDPTPQLELLVYPNPASDRVTIQLPNGQYQFKLYDALQREVRTLKGFSNGEITIGLQGLAPGMYILQVQGQTGQRGTAKLIKE